MSANEEEVHETSSSSILDERIRVDEIYAEVIRDIAESRDASNMFITSITFKGKTLIEHSREFNVVVPDDPGPEDVRAAYLRTVQLIQRAQDNCSYAEGILSALQSGSAKKHSDVVAELVRGYESRKVRRPGQDTLKEMAASRMSETQNVLLGAKILKQYWQRKIDALIEVRKCLEGYNMSLSVEMKYLVHS